MRNYIIIFILILIISGVSELYFSERSERKRFEANYDTVVNDKKDAEILHTTEVKKFYKKLDSLRATKGIREKTVKTVFETKINYIDEEVLIPIYDTIPYFDTIRIVKNYSITKPCYELQLSSINDTILEKLTIHDKLIGFLFWERPYKFLFVRWGSKQYRMKIQSECMGEIIPEKLIIIEK